VRSSSGEAGRFGAAICAFAMGGVDRMGNAVPKWVESFQKSASVEMFSNYVSSKKAGNRENE
jgi:hypothetical protein